MSATQGEIAIVHALHRAITLLEKRRDDLARWDQATEENFFAWFGTDTVEARKLIDARIGRALKTVRHLKVEDFIPMPKPKKAGKSARAYQTALADWNSTFASVSPGYQATRRGPIEMAIVHVGPEFATANDVTRAGTIIHEVSHYMSVGNTDDVEATFLGDPRKPGNRQMYGYTKAERLSFQNPRKALKNADNFEFFVEGHDPADHDLDLDGAGDFDASPGSPSRG